MKCHVCGKECGKYYLCKTCYDKKKNGIIIKCTKCGKWHYKDSACPQVSVLSEQDYIYEVKQFLITPAENCFYIALKELVPEGFIVFPQVNLAAFIDCNDNSVFHNQLFRNVDFLITDENYKPRIAVEINDSTHLQDWRRERDKKVNNILEEAGIPLLTLWISYGVNRDYIKRRLNDLLDNPVIRKKHSSPELIQQQDNNTSQPIIKPISPNDQTQDKKRQGCYIATCVYGSYDCPNVWTLRRFRDDILKKSFMGKLFVRCYYAVSPYLVKAFGNNKIFLCFWKKSLDLLVKRLNKKGIKNTKYNDKY